MHSARNRAFTLVEILVVVAVIAVVLSILFPVLSASRRAHHRAVCADRMRLSTLATLVYTADAQDWLPGPHTSGARFVPNLDRIPFYDEDPSAMPLQNMDWASPSFGLSGDLGAPDLRRAVLLFSEYLNCPSNQFLYNYITTDHGVAPLRQPDVPFNSYSAVIEFHAYPRGGGSDSNLERPALTDRTLGAIRLPAGYRPMLSAIGAASTKVFLQEGARFASQNPDGSYFLSYSAAKYQILGGAFMADGPHDLGAGSDAIAPTVPYHAGDASSWVMTRFNRDLAWRHEDGRNHAFFDGHVEYLSVANALSPSLYVPSRSTVMDDPLAPKTFFSSNVLPGEYIP